MNAFLGSVIKALEPRIVKSNLNVLGQDKYFGLLPVLCVIMLLFFLALLDLVEQVSKSNQ